MRGDTLITFIVFAAGFVGMGMHAEDQHARLLAEQAAHERTKADAALAYDQLAHDMAINYALCLGMGVPAGEE